MVARNFAFSHLQSLYVRSPATYIYIRCNNRLNQRLIYSKHRHCLLKPPSFCTGKNTHLHVLEVRNGSRVINFNCSFFFFKTEKNQQQQTKQCSLFFGAQKLGVVYSKKRTRDIWQYTTWFKAWLYAIGDI